MFPSIVVTALTLALWQQGQGQLIPVKEGDCAGVRCLAACRPGTCSPRPNGICCDDLGKCSPGGCCGNRCRRNSDCKVGPCSECNRGTCGPKGPRLDCAAVRCKGACSAGTCSARPDGACCDDLSKCTPGGCCGDRCRSNRDCKAGPCSKCVGGVCGGKEQVEEDCSAVRCFGACRPGTCSPRPKGECCDDLGRCTPGGCCGDPCERDDQCKAGLCSSCNGGTCGRREEEDCRLVLCFAVCPAGTCAPRPNGECCDSIDKCSPGGCCGDVCSSNCDCKAGPCGRCRRMAPWSRTGTCGS